VNGEQFEVTTLRIDTETDGRHAVVAYTRDFEADAARRDLTINAMSMDFDGNIYDYFGGQEDLRYYRVRFVGDADARVKEDYLRILRYFRFMARFGNIDQCLDEVKAVCTKENLEGLKTISVERYWLEMQKLVTSLYANEVLDCMYYNGVLATLGLKKPFRCLDSTFKDVSVVGTLSTMIAPETIESFMSKWKLSADESKQLRYLVMNRYKRVMWQEDLVDGFPRQWVLDMWVLTGSDQDVTFWVKKWEVPVFPVTGQDLLDRGMKPGVELGNTLRSLRQEWKDSNFKMTKEDLLA
jgi:tRNA nucleotidyltransferase (CCA-adding enzyme)